MCMSSPCFHDGECTELYLQKDYHCTCPPGFKGKRCEIFQPYDHVPNLTKYKLKVVREFGTQFTWKFTPKAGRHRIGQGTGYVNVDIKFVDNNDYVHNVNNKSGSAAEAITLVLMIMMLGTNKPKVQC